MKNGSIEKAIEEFRRKRLGVYRADPEDIERNTGGAERVTKDHVGRWLYELLQNCDDAKASEVWIIVDEDVLYVADNGLGLKAASVRAICGTDLSDKTTGTIGRKGVGFKSVYEVTRNPQVLTVNGEGIEFSPEKTKAWLRENGLDESYVPYQWIPFSAQWEKIHKQDPQLQLLRERGCKTVVRLPGLSQQARQKVEQLLREWPPHALFSFRHLKQITAPGLDISLSSGGKVVWSLQDSRAKTPIEWRVSMETEHPPTDLMDVLSVKERQAISTDGVSFLIAAPLENAYVVPTNEYLPVHVFYPTEQRGVVRMLLHAEFLVKSDRTALVPIDSNPFNMWVADRLAYNICKFVNDSFHSKSPSRNIALLLPFEERASHPVAEILWRSITDKVKTDLRLADFDARQQITVDRARLISVSVHTDLARTLLEFTALREHLLHPAFDSDREARKSLKELGCNEISDQDLMKIIADSADSLSAENDWIWVCWKWLASWTDRGSNEEARKRRLKQASSLPIVPIDGNLVKASDLKDQIVTWKQDTAVSTLPDWLPLTFVDNWFRDLLEKEAEQESLVRKLCKSLGIEKPSPDVVQRSVGKAIKRYWQNGDGDAGRFLRYIMAQDWHETSEALPSLHGCPIPLSKPTQGTHWAEASCTYFGREWGNDLLANLYDGITTVAFAANEATATEEITKLELVLEWLGVAHCPRIMDVQQNAYTRQMSKGTDPWSQYLCTVKDSFGRSVERVGTVSEMEHLGIESLDETQGVILIRLVTVYWNVYYLNRAEVIAEGRLSRERNYRSWRVKAKWWFELCERLSLSRRDVRGGHIALSKL